MTTQLQLINIVVIIIIIIIINLVPLSMWKTKFHTHSKQQEKL